MSTVSLYTPNVSLGTPQVSLGTPQVSLGTPQVSLGTPQVSIGTPQVSLGTPQVSLGTPQVSIGNGVSLGTPQVSVGASIGSSIGSGTGGGGNALADLANLRAQGFYGGVAEEELETMRSTILTQIKKVQSGERVISVTVGGKTVTKQLPTVEELKAEFTEVTNALKALNPQVYGKKRRRFTMDFRYRRS